MIPTNAVKAVIKDAEGNILLLRRSSREKEAGGDWDLPGGLVEEGEDPRIALRREIKEELGVDAEVKGPQGQWQFFRPKDERWVKVQNYACTIRSTNIELSDEHLGYEWVAPGRLKEYQVKNHSLYAAITGNA